MKRSILFLAALLMTSNSYAEVGVSVSIGEPGFYGQIEIGDRFPAPRVVYARPIIIERGYAREEPIYMRVPHGHQKHWSKFCGRYNACGRPVYFINDTWYNDTYVPRYREYHERGDDGRRFERGDHGDNDHWKNKKHRYNHDNDHDNTRGHDK